MIEIATLKLALPKQKRNVIATQTRDLTCFRRGEFLPGSFPFILHTVVNLQIICSEHSIKLYYTIPMVVNSKVCPPTERKSYSVSNK